MQVVGMQGYEQLPISENRIRAEHGLPYRVSYNDRCTALDAPDETRLAQPPIAI